MTVANINKMIDYCIKMPEKDEYESGHRYPYYSCELLCSFNGLNIDRLIETYIEEQNNESLNNNENKEEGKKNVQEFNEEDTEKENQKENEEEKDEILKENGNNKDKNNNQEIKNEEIKENDNEIKKDEIENNNNDMNKNKNDIQKDENKTNENNIENTENIEKVDSTSEEKDTTKEEKPEENNKEKEKEEITKMEIEESESQHKEIKAKNSPNLIIVYSVFDHLFSFLDNKSSLENTVLCGYFNKIVNYLIKTKTRITLEYILLYRTNLLPKFLENINKISISNIISNILNALTDENSPEANEKYLIIVNECINYISKTENKSEDDINFVEYICDLIINHIIYNNKIKFSKIIDANIIIKFEEIIKKLYENYEQNLSKIILLINLLTKMNKSILSNFVKKITTSTNPDDSKIEMMNLINAIEKSTNQYISLTIKRNDFKELVYSSFINNYISHCNSINNICLTIINNKLKKIENNSEKLMSIITSYSEKKIEKYSLSNIAEFEFIVSSVDIYINLYNLFIENEKKYNFILEKIDQLTKTNIFRIIFEDYLKYKHNNFLSNIIVDLFKIVFDNNIAPKELISNILQIYSDNKEDQKDNIINLLINDLIQNTKFFYENSNNKTNQWLFSSNITILKYIFSSSNPNVSELLNPFEKEKFFYKHFITNIHNLFTKKLYKTDSNDSVVDKINSLGIRFGFSTNLKESDTKIEFSVESLNSIIEFYLMIYDKYIKGEEYEYLFEERKQKLEEIKKSQEYLNLYKQKEDELEEEENEDDDINEINLPKPTFYNSKLEKENDKKDDNNNNSINMQENIEENKDYNDVNYWHIEINDKSMEDLLKDL